jgi:hypothetical protein
VARTVTLLDHSETIERDRSELWGDDRIAVARVTT